MPPLSRPAADGPLLVFGPRSPGYDFGPGHPLTPRRFGPGIDLLRSVGAEPGLRPEPASDDDLLRVHAADYLATVRAFGADPSMAPRHGIGTPDDPAFAGMHEASASVAGGSLRAMEAILRGDVEHAHHPGGGLHHAMRANASGFCIYNDPALAVVRARAEGLRVLYVDLDVHHGDGVEAACRDDPGVLTVSLHESGRYLFPGTGEIADAGAGAAAGSVVNVPLEPFTGDAVWLPAVRALIPSLAAVFGPDVVVSQHGADSHAWDPLAHLRVTTTAMAEAARVVDGVAHRWASGRWLATGGGGYDVYRVVPRAWSLTWLAGAHREPRDETPAAWRDRWAPDAQRFGTPGMPVRFLDEPNAGWTVDRGQEEAEQRSRATVAAVRRLALPLLVREAEDRGWWRPQLSWAGRALRGDEAGEASAADPAARPRMAPAPATSPAAAGKSPSIRSLTLGELDRLGLAHRVIPPFDPEDGRAILAAMLASGGRVVAALAGDAIVGAAVAGPAPSGGGAERLLALGVAPDLRRRGLASALLRRLVDARTPGSALEAHFGLAERDVVEPLPVDLRGTIARQLLAGGGFELVPSDPDLARRDRWSFSGVLRAR